MHALYASELTDAHGAERETLESKLAEVESVEQQIRVEHAEELATREELHAAAQASQVFSCLGWLASWLAGCLTRAWSDAF